MTQLALNLLSNAADHTPVLGCITLRTACVHGLASLSVSDTGVGIRAEDLPRIFDRFFRADDSRSRKTGGAGLGLAICKAIAEAHHARLGVSSAPGEGSTFTLEMPALESAGVDTSYGGDA
jgi:two-component system sensor histidine kinase BaeS